MNPEIGYIPVVCQKDHLALISPLPGIIRQQTRKEQLLIITVGRKQNQIRCSVLGQLPTLYPVRRGTGSKQKNLVQQSRSVIKGDLNFLRHIPKGTLDIHKFMHQGILSKLPAFSGIRIRHCKYTVSQIEDQIGRTDSTLMFQANRRRFLHLHSLCLIAVKETFHLIDALAGHHLNFAGNLLRFLDFFRPGRHSQQRANQQRQHDTPYPIHMCHFPSK